MQISDWTLHAAVNLLENRYTILENEMMINNLVLGTRGEVLLLEDGAMDLDISFFSKKTSFQTLLSLIPAIYLSDFESLEASGSLVLEGDVKGIMADSLMPDVLVKLEVTDGYFSYPELPKDVSDVQIKMVANYDGKNTDQTTVDVEKFHLLMAGNPFDIKLRVDHPISDMHVAGEMKGIIDFGSLKDVLPLEDMKLEGRMTSDLRVDTRMSYIEQENFEAVDLNGLLLVEGMVLETPDIPVPVEIRKMEMIFNPRYVSLSGADLQLGQSDLQMEGAMSNFIPYVFKGETISGALKVSSTLLNADELLAETEEAGVDSSEPAAGALPDSLSVPSPAKIPANVDIVLELDLKKLIYEGILLEDITGELKFKEGVAYMDGLEMDVIKGHATAQGKVDTRGEFTAAELTLDLQEVDIPTAYSTFITVERLAPMAKYCMGYANLKLDFASLLDASFSPLYESVSAEGRIFTRDLKIYNTSSFVRLSEILKNEKFREMAPDDMNIKFRIKEGKVIVDPFDLMFNESKITVSGLHGIDMSMNYLLDMKIAKSDLGKGAGEILDGVSAMALSAGIAIPQSDYIKIRAMIKGTFQDPQITTDLSSNLATGKAEVKKMVEERVIEEIEKVEEEIREGASEKADEILKQAEQESARVMNEAREAGEQLIQEAEKQGENLIKEAGSNPLKKMAANKAADELLRQAQKQSDNLLKEAQLKADEIMEKTKTEAGRI